MNHKCIIGMIQSNCTYKLVTLEQLKQYIFSQEEFYALMKDCGYDWALKTRSRAFTLKEYADKRKNTDLRQFAYCPECGKPVDWKQIRRENT